MAVQSCNYFINHCPYIVDVLLYYRAYLETCCDIRTEPKVEQFKLIGYTPCKYIWNKKHYEGTNIHRAWFWKQETIYSGMKPCRLLLLVSISWINHEYPSIRYSVMLPTNMDQEIYNKTDVGTPSNPRPF